MTGSRRVFFFPPLYLRNISHFFFSVNGRNYCVRDKTLLRVLVILVYAIVSSINVRYCKMLHAQPVVHPVSLLFQNPKHVLFFFFLLSIFRIWTFYARAKHYYLFTRIKVTRGFCDDNDSMRHVTMFDPGENRPLSFRDTLHRILKLLVVVSRVVEMTPTDARGDLYLYFGRVVLHFEVFGRRPPFAVRLSYQWWKRTKRMK